MKTTTATSFLVFTGRPFSGRPCVLELLDYTLLKWLENQLQKTEAEHNILPLSVSGCVGIKINNIYILLIV